jgi:fatty-acyl-CoA synthase
VLIVDAGLWDGIAAVLRDVGSLQHVIVIGAGAMTGAGAHATARGVAIHDYETLLAAALGRGFECPDLDENSAAAACYTSGTTGDPKGIVYSHRSIFLHTLATLGVDAFAVSQHDRILLLPSMFHANAWGLPYSAWFAGADLILPGPHLKSDAIRRMIREVRPTFTALVPTLINDLLEADRRDPVDMSSFRVLVSGGSAVSPALIRTVRERWGIPVMQGWGMTETSPMCCLSVPPRTPPSRTRRSGGPGAGVRCRAWRCGWSTTKASPWQTMARTSATCSCGTLGHGSVPPRRLAGFVHRGWLAAHGRRRHDRRARLRRSRTAPRT